AVTGRIEDSNGDIRPGDAITTFNSKGSYFTGKITLNSGRVDDLIPHLTSTSSMYGLKLNEIQQVAILHELVHAFDPKNKWADWKNPSTVAQLNREIRKACF